MKAHICFFGLLVSFCMANSADLNSDHKVNMQDFVIFSRCWKAQAGHSAYNDLCDLAEPKNQGIDGNDLLAFADNWLWRAIQIDIYSDGGGHYCDTVWLDGEGSWTIQFTDPEEFEGYEGQYYAYAFHEGDFTEVFSFSAEDITFPPWADPTFEAVVEVDLDPIDPNRFNGTIFLAQPFFKAAYLADEEVTVLDWSTGQPVTVFTTDSQGRFSVELAEGFYWFVFYEGSQQHMEEALVYSSYQDFLFPAFEIMLKPNIYLYPETTINLTVTLEFPSGGGVIDSDPDYVDGWQITVEPTGLIDGLYEYLFYESVQPDYGQYEAGWVVARGDLEAFFRTNLAQTGFVQNEIDDFIEYWIPRLIEDPYFAIYPQYSEQLDRMVRLNFSQPPDNLIRLIYAVRGLADNFLQLSPPQIPLFSRDGFTAAEWGVILQ